LGHGHISHQYAQNGQQNNLFHISEFSGLKISGLFRFKSEHKGKAARVFQTLTRLNTIETDTIVEAQQTKHGQEESHTQTRTAAQTEGVIVAEIEPSIGGFKEGQAIDGATWVGHERIAQLQLVFVENGKEAAGLLLIGIDGRIRCLIYRITTMRNDIVTQ